MTDKEKAERYDSLRVAMKIYLESYQKDIKKPLPEWARVGDNLRSWEEGKRAAEENFVEILGRWLG